MARLAGRMTPAGKRPCRGCRQNADALEFPEGSPAALRESFRGPCVEASVGESSLPRRGGAACGGSSWEWGDVVATGFGVPVHWSVWWRCDVLRVASTPLGDGVVVRVTHDAQLSCP